MDALRAVAAGGRRRSSRTPPAPPAPRYRGRPAGGLGDIAAFSFHPRKSITTGEGGMVTTGDAALAETRRARCATTARASPRSSATPAPRRTCCPTFDDLGFNYRMTDLQAAVGLVQLAQARRASSPSATRSPSATTSELGRRSPGSRSPERPADGTATAGSRTSTLVERRRAAHAATSILAALHELGIGARPGTHAVTELGVYRRRERSRPRLAARWRPSWRAARSRCPCTTA